MSTGIKFPVKQPVCFFILLFACHVACGQPVAQVTPGAVIKSTGGVLITIQDMDLHMNGVFDQAAGMGKLRFSGNTTSIINAVQTLQLDLLQIDKSNNEKLVLSQSIQLGTSLEFLAGRLDLGDHHVLLAANAFLSGENDQHHAFSTGDGYVEINQELNTNAPVNPGALGAEITAHQLLGMTRIRRSHRPIDNIVSNNPGIARVFDIQPAVNNGHDATLRLYYLEPELNGLSESTLGMYRRDAPASWVMVNPITRSTDGNYLEAQNVHSFSEWTIAASSDPLPLQFVKFSVACGANLNELKWTTVFEENTGRFDVQRSLTGVDWTVIGSVPAAGMSTVETDYSFTDSEVPAGAAFYRIAEYDIDGTVFYSPTIMKDCQPGNMQPLVFPNPFYDRLHIRYPAVASGKVVATIMDQTGKTVMVKRSPIATGSNDIVLETGRLAAGIYFMRLEMDGVKEKTIRILKR